MTEQHDIKTVVGIFKDNEITFDSGEIIKCITYKSLRQKIENKYGAFNLKKNTHGDWVIFQFMEFYTKLK